MSKRRVCTKRRYSTEVDALIVSARARAIDNPRRRTLEMRAYLCEVCREWHLTSQPKRGRDRDTPS